MSLLFGRLTQDFVNFQTTLFYAQAGDPTAAAKIPQAAANFRHGAAQNATYLVIIGASMTGLPFEGIIECRNRTGHARLYFCPHVHLGIYRRSQREEDP